MVTKSKAAQNRGKVKVGKLKLNKETVKDLSGSERKKVKGGLDFIIAPIKTSPCIPVIKSADNRCRPTDGPACGNP